MSHEVLVIGSGPAGLSAAINARTRGRSVLVVSNPPEENPLWPAGRVDNYPGLPGVSGRELLTVMRRQAEEAGAEFFAGRALNALRISGTWYIGAGPRMLAAKAVVLAGGVVRGRKFPGEEEFLGRGVSYCATCDGMLYRDRPVAVVGFSDSARREADFLRSIGCAVTYFDRPKRCVIQGGQAVESITCDGQSAAVDAVFLLRPTMAPTDLF